MHVTCVGASWKRVLNLCVKYCLPQKIIRINKLLYQMDFLQSYFYFHILILFPFHGLQGLHVFQGLHGLQGLRGLRGLQGLHGLRSLQELVGLQEIQGTIEEEI